MKKITWTIAGADSSGGAGIQADLKTFQNFGVHGCSIITAVTAQNNKTIQEIQYTSAKVIESQINSLNQEFFPQAIKIGMLGDVGIIKKIKKYLYDYPGFVVLDPVLTSSSGRDLFDNDLKEYLFDLKKLFPLVNIITPNIIEAEKLLNRKIFSYADIEESAHEILCFGPKSVLIKGGHFLKDDFSQDYWTNGVESFWISHKRFPNKNYRGTGCTLASAIAAALALGYGIKDAIVIAKMYVNQGVRLAETMQNTSFLGYPGFPQYGIDLPFVTHQPIFSAPKKFNPCNDSLGIYPVVDSIDWIKKLLPTNINSIQLRIKNKNGQALENEIKESINIAKKYEKKLFVNDYWELAIHHGAYGVHLGQEDINSANIDKIRNAGLCLGISTHCYYEIARAHALNPSYIACGPVFPTTSKVMPFSPIGITQLKHWRQLLNYPIVAIGGINPLNIDEVIQTGVDGIAMISAITKAKDPIRAINNLVNHYVTYA